MANFFRAVEARLVRGRSAIPTALGADAVRFGHRSGVEDERLALLLGASGHALDFRTWRSPVRQQGLDEEQR